MLLHTRSRGLTPPAGVRRGLVAVLAVTAALTGSALQTSPSSAESITPVIIVAPAFAHPQQRVAVVGSGFVAGETAAVTLDQQDIGSATVDGSGSFVVSFTVGADATYGEHTVEATGQTGGDVARTVLNVRNNWSQFMRAGPHQGYNPYERTLTRDNVANLSTAWRFEYPSTCTSRAGPSIVNGRVYVGSSCGVLFVVDENTGQLLWRRSLGATIDGVPAVSHHRVFVATGGRNSALYALDAETGQRLWTRSLPGTASPTSTTVRDALVYQTSDEGNVVAVRTKNGKVRWQRHLPGVLRSTVLVTEGAAYVGSSNGYLYALHARTGDLRWRGDTGGPILHSSPVRVGETVVIGSDTHTLVAFDRGGCGASSCSPAWHSRGLVAGSGTPTTAYGTVFAAERRTVAGSSVLDAFPAAGCGVSVCDAQWSVNLPGGRVDRGGAAAGHVVYLTTAHTRVVAVDSATGEVLWTYQEASDQVGSTEPVVTDGTLFLNLPGSRALLALRPPA